MTAPLRRAINRQADIEQVRRETRGAALALGFSRTNAEEVVLAVSELATNLLRYAYGGELIVATAVDSARTGLRIESHDTGPGIADPAQALQDGYSTAGSLGGGLGAVQRLMDDFQFDSTPEGTQIVAHKWLPQN